MITLNILPKDLYNLIFDIGRSDREHIEDIPLYLAEQYLANQELYNLIYVELIDNKVKLWRLDAWKRSYMYHLKSKEEQREDSRKWNLMKSAAKVLTKKLGNMDYDSCFLLVQREVKRKRWVILKACGVDVEGEEWKGLVDLPDGKME